MACAPCTSSVKEGLHASTIEACAGRDCARGHHAAGRCWCPPGQGCQVASRLRDSPGTTRATCRTIAVRRSVDLELSQRIAADVIGRAIRLALHDPTRHKNALGHV